jgi:hypothetical protein
LLWQTFKQKIELAARQAKVPVNALQITWGLRHGEADFTITVQGKTTHLSITYGELLRDNSHPSYSSPLAKGIIKEVVDEEATMKGVGSG